MNRFHYLNEVYEPNPCSNGVNAFLSTSRVSKNNFNNTRGDNGNGLNMGNVLECAYGSYGGRNQVLHKTMNFPKQFNVTRNHE